MKQDKLSERYNNVAIECAEKLASFVCQKLVEGGVYREVKFIREYDRLDIVYAEGVELHKFAFIAIDSIKPVRGTLIDVEFYFGLYEEGYENPAVDKCMNSAFKEYCNAKMKKVED